MMMKFDFICVRLNVYNYEACLHFYRDILGFESIFVSEKDGCAELDTGTVKLALIKQNNLNSILGSVSSGSRSQSNDGISLSFQVYNLYEVTRQLKEQGVKFVLNTPWSFPDWGFSSTFCRDPDENLIEIQQLIS